MFIFSDSAVVNYSVYTDTGFQTYVSTEKKRHMQCAVRFGEAT